MCNIRISEGITKILDKIIRDFIWGTTQERKKMHLIAWDTVTLPKDLGGLGIQKTAIRNKVILNGLAWRVCQGNPNIWKSVLHNKFKNHPVHRFSGQGISSTWKNIQDGWKSITSATKWVVQKGDQVNFFHDNWLPHFVPFNNAFKVPCWNKTITCLLQILDNMGTGTLKGCLSAFQLKDDEFSKILSSTIIRVLRTRGFGVSHQMSSSLPPRYILILPPILRLKMSPRQAMTLWLFGRGIFQVSLSTFCGFYVTSGWKLIKGFTPWECLTLPVASFVEIIARISRTYSFNAILQKNSRGRCTIVEDSNMPLMAELLTPQIGWTAGKGSAGNLVQLFSPGTPSFPIAFGRSG